jgi:hypothetical protein
MDVNTHPEFAPTYAGIRRQYGDAWAKRFVLTAPLLLGDPKGPVFRAFRSGLAAHAAGDALGEDRAWATCRALMSELAASLVAEAERFLTDA